MERFFIRRIIRVFALCLMSFIGMNIYGNTGLSISMKDLSVQMNSQSRITSGTSLFEMDADEVNYKWIATDADDNIRYTLAAIDGQPDNGFEIIVEPVYDTQSAAFNANIIKDTNYWDPFFSAFTLKNLGSAYQAGENVKLLSVTDVDLIENQFANYNELKTINLKYTDVCTIPEGCFCGCDDHLENITIDFTGDNFSIGNGALPSGYAFNVNINGKAAYDALLKYKNENSCAFIINYDSDTTTQLPDPTEDLSELMNSQTWLGSAVSSYSDNVATYNGSFDRYTVLSGLKRGIYIFKQNAYYNVEAFDGKKGGCDEELAYAKINGKMQDICTYVAHDGDNDNEQRMVVFVVNSEDEQITIGTRLPRPCGNAGSDFYNKGYSLCYYAPTDYMINLLADLFVDELKNEIECGVSGAQELADEYKKTYNNWDKLVDLRGKYWPLRQDGQYIAGKDDGYSYSPFSIDADADNFIWTGTNSEANIKYVLSAINGNPEEGFNLSIERIDKSRSAAFTASMYLDNNYWEPLFRTITKTLAGEEMNADENIKKLSIVDVDMIPNQFAFYNELKTINLKYTDSLIIPDYCFFGYVSNLEDLVADYTGNNIYVGSEALPEYCSYNIYVNGDYTKTAFMEYPKNYSSSYYYNVIYSNKTNEDVNCDDVVDTQDVLSIYNYMSDQSGSSGSDVNGDGIVDTQDVLNVYEYIKAH